MRHTNALLSKPDPKRAERRWSLVLFVLTCTTVFGVRLFRWQPDASTGFLEAALSSATFAVALMTILVAHEMGHFFAARKHRFTISLPWFLPFPFLIGTLGALIRFRDKPPNRNALMEMAVAGPLAGMVMTCMVLIVWAWAASPSVSTNEPFTLGTPVIFSVVSLIFHGTWAVSVSAYDSLGFAAWIGCFITAINLLPFGQLDGGHIVFALAPARARAVGWLVTGLLLLGGFFWFGWLLWVVVLHLIGTRHPVDLRRSDSPLSLRAKWGAALCVLTWACCFTPIPVMLLG